MVIDSTARNSARLEVELAMWKSPLDTALLVWGWNVEETLLTELIFYFWSWLSCVVCKWCFMLYTSIFNMTNAQYHILLPQYSAVTFHILLLFSLLAADFISNRTWWNMTRSRLRLQISSWSFTSSADTLEKQEMRLAWQQRVIGLKSSRDYFLFVEAADTQQRRRNDIIEQKKTDSLSPIRTSTGPRKHGWTVWNTDVMWPLSNRPRSCLLVTFCDV